MLDGAKRILNVIIAHAHWHWKNIAKCTCSHEFWEYEDVWLNAFCLIGSCRREMAKCLTYGQQQQYGFGFGFDYHLSLRSRLKYSMTMIYSFHFHSWWLRLKKCSTENILKTIISDFNTFQHPSSKFTIQISFSNSIVYEND